MSDKEQAAAPANTVDEEQPPLGEDGKPLSKKYVVVLKHIGKS